MVRSWPNDTKSICLCNYPAAAPEDIFVFITTSSVPSLQVNGTYNVPPGCVVVTEENRMEAARIYLRSS